LGKLGIEGDTPVLEIENWSEMFLSSVGHVKSRMNLGGPPSKAKYSSATDSELVP